MVHKVKPVSLFSSGTFKHWAVVYNPQKPDAKGVAEKVVAFLISHGCTAHACPSPDGCAFEGVDAIATIGGDGTMLGCVEAAMKAHVPLVGVNMGKLGYLTRVAADEIEKSFGEILAGHYRKFERTALEVTFPDGSRHIALNDVVIKSAEFRLAELGISVDGEHVVDYNCDGVILATPTGSTAYNLSAGGPLLHQSVEGVVMTPICPHSLKSRSVIFSSHCSVRVEHTEVKSKVHINVDGRATAEGVDCLPIEVRKSPQKVITLEAPNCNGFDILRTKLGW